MVEKEQVASIIEEIVECCLKWFGHVWRRHVEALIRKVEQMLDREVVFITRGRRETVRNYRWNH